MLSHWTLERTVTSDPEIRPASSQRRAASGHASGERPCFQYGFINNQR